MLSKEHHQQHRSQFPPDMFKQSTSGTLSPDTTTTTSSGYSTGGSSVSTRINPSLKKLASSSSSSATSTIRKEHHQQQKQQKTKSKGKKKQESNARGERTYLRSSYFDSASTDDIYYIFLIYTLYLSIYLSFYSPTKETARKKEETPE
jgi:hypothetical protein